ncbi:hypothetical protein [Acidobacterium sp. S8]|uniref:hypothetical protein n=1 Tax=Acidobacterium sp. S8 TaxID=1641854 RepID=UPI00131BEFAA|nr:hypothetical protein [Acidobacterium sp. S8]
MREAMSIWFFAGVLFLLYGIIILAEGFWELSHPPANPPVLFNLHPSIWWGAMMTVAGLAYTVRFWPRVKR